MGFPIVRKGFVPEPIRDAFRVPVDAPAGGGICIVHADAISLCFISEGNLYKGRLQSKDALHTHSTMVFS